ncbi:cytochrome P450 [Ferruginivarius sediminum]|uniref:Cytochrome P450 n=2 Tax=Ferruginivarius sediminum TaxID=2661937 RepID=A0A369T8T3_9PROT|nr:cytochrome P450 [Ferruginivarius sediminum]
MRMADMAVDTADEVIGEASGRPASPPGYPLLGVAPQIRRDPLGFFVKMAREYGDVVDLNVAGKRMVLANEPTLIRQVLQANAGNYRKSKFYGPLKPIGTGLLTSEGEQWVEQRKAAAPAFKGSEMGKICAAMADEADTTLAGWAARGQADEPLDVAREMMRLALRIAMRTLFGSPLREDTASKVSDALAVALRHAEERIWSVASPPLWVPTPGNRAFARAITQLDEVFEDIISARKSSGERPGDLLDLLIDAFDDDRPQLRDMVVSMLVTGHETTAVSLAWAFYLLSRNPEWAEAVRSEANEVLGSDTPDIQALRGLRVTRAVFEEAMRLYPPVWTFSRDALSPERLGNVELRKGDTVMVCAYSLHRHPRLWESPETFMPQRFLNNEGQNRTNYNYLPFGGGPRSCIGNRFAMTEATIILAKTLQRFDLDLVDGHAVEPEPMITLRPRFGMLMRPRAVA